jgi:hypothetical protein
MAGLPHSWQVSICTPILAGAVFLATQIPVTCLRSTNLNVGGEMHAGINCIQAQHSRAWHLTTAAVIGRWSKILRKIDAIPKPSILRHIRTIRNASKEQKRSFWTILHFFADLRVHSSRHPRFHIPVWEFRGRQGKRPTSDFLIWPMLTISDHSLLQGNAWRGE